MSGWKQERDMSKEKFLERAAAYGWKPAGFMGYFERAAEDGTRLSVSTWNAGTRRRSQLAYLIAAGERQDVEAGERLASRAAEGRT